ncbi:hypothetical protein TSA66_00125 [Noviherbaspirillum autotrophicum]|uniref:Acyltransferase 3 domain-containing protein n=2 Tax=Noviherbaspirillum autotrophicum TaxID=709839 RepID=A0A0C2BXG2_9BURK|nr:hypothetical protein TSA66_20855 [Noviherbaspirillum autotrophicum]KIF84171.1 hypothetical protein TSA66_00125 [Noviherbaspirillum autotrophicum]
MITAFLFTSRVVLGKPVNWYALFLTRITRLTPLYVIFVAFVALSVFSLTNWELREPLFEVIGEIAHWLAFVFFARPDINGLDKTWILVAGVNWSLKFEWIFYVFLPVIYLIFKPCKSVRVAALLSVVLLIVTIAIGRLYFTHFVLGMLIAILYKHPNFFKVTRSWQYRCLAALCAVCLLLFKDGSATAPAFLAAVAFSAVVSGASMWGILRCKGMLWLGEISYGVYLIHGLFLYWVLTYLRAQGVLANLGLIPYALVVGGIAIVVVLVASAAHIFIELPGIRAGKQIVDRRRCSSAVRGQADLCS